MRLIDGLTLIANVPTASHSTVAVSSATRSVSESSWSGPAEKLTMLTGPMVCQKARLEMAQLATSPPLNTNSGISRVSSSSANRPVRLSKSPPPPYRIVCSRRVIAVLTLKLLPTW